jgi:hypothetical protein
MRQILAAMALLLAVAARGGGGTPVRLSAGEVVKLCQAGLARCPASAFLCDDPKIALIENGPEGVELKGIAPGTTVCSVLGPGQAFRAVLDVTVTPPPEAPK